MAKRLGVIIVLLGCSRDIARLSDPSAQPAFLLDSSGIYIDPTADVPTEVDVLAVGHNLLVTGGGLFSFTGVLNPANDGTPALVSHTQTQFKEDDRSFNFYLFLRLGLGAMQFSSSAVADENFCESPARDDDPGNCTSLIKECDFDPNRAGVYRAAVALTASAGDCIAAGSFAGDRSWALSIAQSINAASILSLNGDTPEWALALHYDPVDQKLALADALLPTGDWVSGSSFTAQVSLPGNTIELTTDFVRALPNGCTQTYHATATRLSGTEPGIACPVQNTAAICPVYGHTCPQLGLNGGTDTLTLDAGETCPEASCVESVSGSQLCDPASRAIALNGCTSGQTVQAQAGAGACLSLGCVAVGTCDQALPSGTLGFASDTCGDQDVVQLSVENDCWTVSCLSASGALARDPPCAAFGAPPPYIHDGAPGGVPYCDLYNIDDVTSNASVMLGLDTHDLADVGTLLAQGPYQIVDFDPPLDGSQTQVQRHAIIQSGGSCPPIDLAILHEYCPPQFAPMTVCAPQDSSSVLHAESLVLYRSDLSSLCFAAVDEDTQTWIGTGCSRSACCNPGQRACCGAPDGFVQCLGDTQTLTIDNQTGSDIDLTYTVTFAGFLNDASITATANTQTSLAPEPSGTVFTLAAAGASLSRTTVTLFYEDETVTLR